MGKRTDDVINNFKWLKRICFRYDLNVGGWHTLLWDVVDLFSINDLKTFGSDQIVSDPASGRIYLFLQPNELIEADSIEHAKAMYEVLK